MQPPAKPHASAVGRRARATLFGLALCCGLTAAAAGERSFESGPSRVTLIELYTSEGCSSCPPADRWLNALTNDARLWREVVPVAFHVDYWDYIGWKDRFASERFSQRQQLHRAQGNVRTVYTPGLVVAGREWRGWFSDPTLRLGRAPDAGTLSVQTDGGRLEARFLPGRDPGRGPVLNIAVLGFELETQVRAGENRGRRLSHGFVVLGYSRVPMRRGADGALTAAAPLPKAKASAPRLALAAWVEAGESQAPLQAVGGWLD